MWLANPEHYIIGSLVSLCGATRYITHTIMKSCSDNFEINELHDVSQSGYINLLSIISHSLGDCLAGWLGLLGACVLSRTSNMAPSSCPKHVVHMHVDLA